MRGLYQVCLQAGFGAFLVNTKAPNLSPDLTMRYLLEYLVGSGVKSTTTARYPILGLAISPQALKRVGPPIKVWTKKFS